MKNKTYLKATFREISKSKGRFIAIVLIILLGSLLYVGIKTAHPVLDYSANEYVKTQNLADLQIISTGGLTADDEKLLTDLKGVTAESGHQLYWANSEKNEVVQAFSYHKEAKLNQLELVSGHLPEKNDEILLDEQAKQFGYHLGDEYLLEDKDQLTQTTFTIVGFVKSPLFINDLERGYTNVGNGTVSYFAYLPEAVFSAKIKSVLYLSFENTQKLATYSEAYKKQMTKNKEMVESLFSKRPKERLEELQTTASQTLAPKILEVEKAEKSLVEGKAQLTAAQKQLDTANSQLENLPSLQQATAKEQLATQQAQLAEQLKEITAQEEKLTEAKRQITQAQTEISELKTPVYSFNKRFDNVGFQEYGSLSGRIDAIADVFPVFFFFVAALITFTTMTRMVEENRREIGTLKALGYGKLEIAEKYIIYSLLAAALGLILGVVIGTNFLPRVIFYLMSDHYIFEKAYIFYVGDAVLKASGAFLIATLGAALFVLLGELREKPAQLLQVKAPKPGKRIFLERITPIWKRLSFNQKVSYRNLFRYKARMWMAIIGIAGCTGLMLAGFGLKDSLTSVTKKQFGPIFDYEAIVTLDKDQLTAENLRTVNKQLQENSQVTSTLPSKNETLEIKEKNKATQNLTLMVPEDSQTFQSYLHLKDSHGKKLALTETGGMITQKTAEFYELKKGDTITVYNSDKDPLLVKISGITANYLGSFLYVSSDYYEKISGENFTPNSFLVKTEKMTKTQEETLAKNLLDTGSVINTNFTSKQIETQDGAMSNLDAVVWILVTLSGVLAFVVLYNLTNINISERVRELSTIKVLGFFNREVTMYIVRENIIFTLLGILGGFGIGRILTHFILEKASMENLVFPLVIKGAAYFYAGGLTILFTIIVMVFTHFKLQHIHMIDALKSNE